LTLSINEGFGPDTTDVSDPSYRKRMEASGIGSIEPDEAMEALEVLLSEPVSSRSFRSGFCRLTLSINEGFGPDTTDIAS
jgi:hypothetical protein